MNQTVNKAVITGGEGDLARALATQLTADGLQVDAPGRRQLDVTDPQAVAQYFNMREVDLLICNAGITRDHNLARLTESDWNEVMQVNLHGVVQCIRAALPGFIQKGGGHIVLISSYSALHPPIGQAAYATAKASLLGLMNELSAELGENHIRINTILPGFLDTRMTSSVSEERKQQVIAQHALKRLNTSTRVAAFISFLHREMVHTSGQVFQLDSRSPF